LHENKGGEPAIKTKFLAIILAATILLTILTIVVAQQLIWYEATNENQGEVTGEILIEYRFGDEVTVDGDIIDWGSLSPGGVYIKSLNITNIYTDQIIVFLLYDDLPTGWTLIWAGNNTKYGTLLPPNQQVIGNIILTLPATVTPGTYAWNTTVSAKVV